MGEEGKVHKHPWKARLFVALFMLLMAFSGLVVSDVKQDGAWTYWRIMVPCFALICLWLSWYLRRSGKHPLSPVKIWHEMLHWLALIICVYLVSMFVQMGVMGKVDASLVVMTLLALTTFIAGIYVEATFMVIGIALGLFALGAALAIAYLYTVMLPITIVIAIILVWMIHRSRKKHEVLQDKRNEKFPPEDPFS